VYERFAFEKWICVLFLWIERRGANALSAVVTHPVSMCVKRVRCNWRWELNL
jgi:hypothetical protein